MRSSKSPKVEIVKHAWNGVPAALGRFFQISDGLHNLGIRHVACAVIVLIHGKDAGVLLIRLVKIQEICRVFRDDTEAMGRGIGEVDIVVLAFQSRVSGTNNRVAALAEKIG